MNILYLKISTSLIFLFFILTTSYAENSKTVKGTATPITEANLTYSFRETVPGKIIYTAKEGCIAKGPVYNKDGKIIKEGDLLLKIADGRRKNVVKERNHMVKVAKAVLDFAKLDLERYKTLQKPGRKIAPRQHLEMAESKYLQAMSNYYNKMLDVERATNWVESATRRSDFDCLVTDVNNACGYATSSTKILKITQLNPMGIKLTLPRDEAYELSDAKKIEIYPLSSNIPVTALSNDFIYVKDGVLVRVPNSSLYPGSIVREGKNIPVLNDIFSIYSNQDNKLTVAKNALIEKDNKHYLLYKAIFKAKQDFNGKVIKLYSIQKVSVETENTITQPVPNMKQYVLRPNKNLSQSDIVLPNTLSDKFKDGDLVFIAQERYKFMPDDPVKIKIVY
ncbi:MAG TPA: hypothetical protein QF753_06620 [Victivallales bacterium]|nr:hypothetical protein [Victivallales bacterium]